MTKEQAKNNLLINSNNLLYCFVPNNKTENNIIFGKYSDIIWDKSLDQKQYVSAMASKAGISVQEAYTLINNSLKDTYGLTASEILVKLCKGEQVLGKDWNAGIFGLSNCYVGSLSNTWTMSNIKSADGSYLYYKSVTGQFGQMTDTGKIKPVTYRNDVVVNNGNVQSFAYYDQKNNTVYSALNQENKTTIKTTTSSNSGSKVEIWTDIISSLPGIINSTSDLVAAFTGYKKTDEFAPNQYSDGFNTYQISGFTNPSSNTYGIALAVLLLGGGVYLATRSTNKNKK